MSGRILELLEQAATPVSFSPEKEVERETLRAIFAAGRIAPSADNLQIWRFVVAEEAAVKKGVIDSLIDKSEQMLFAKAPVVVACLGAPWLIKSAKKEQPFFMIDVPIAVSHLLLAAADLGLASAFSMQVDEPKLLDAVSAVENKYRAMGLLALGYGE
jgi:nitroreductase